MRYPLLCCVLLVVACQTLRSDPQGQMARLAGTSWRVDSIAGAKASPEIESTLEVDEEAEVAGRGGCNHYVSDIGIEEGALRFEKPLASEFDCTDEQVDQEKRFFEALAATRRTRIERNNLLLQDQAGHTLVRLKPLTLTLKPM